MAKDPKKNPLDPVSLSTWARLRSAGKAPVGGKPYGAEVHTPKTRKRKKAK